MKTRTNSILALLACSALSFGCHSTDMAAESGDHHADGHDSDGHHSGEHTDSEAPMMTEEEMMEMMMKMGAPGAQHELLAGMAGEWTAVSKMSMSPTDPPVETASTSSNKMIFGGRYLMCDYSGSFMGAPFTGLGLVGFDNTTQQYQQFWIDNSGTTMAPPLHGAYDEAAKQLTLAGSMDNQMYGTMKMRQVYTFNGPDSYHFEMFTDMGAGEMSSMTIEYSRK